MGTPKNDPFTGTVRGGEDLVWWNAKSVGLRLVAKVDGVFEGKKVTFAKLYDAVEFRTADHFPLRHFEEVAVTTMDAKIRSDDAGSIAIITATASKPGKKEGTTYMTFETRIAKKGTPEFDNAAALLGRARAKLAVEAVAAEQVETPESLDAEDDDLPF